MKHSKSNEMKHAKNESLKNDQCDLNANTDNPLTIKGFMTSKLRSALTWTVVVLSLGLLRLYFFWKPSLMLKCTHKRCSLAKATRFLIIDKYKQEFIENCEVINGLKFNGLLNVETENDCDNGTEKEALISGNETFRYFVNKREKFYWNFKKSAFEPLLGIETNGIPFSQIRQVCVERNGISTVEATERQAIYGPNSVRVELTPLGTLFIREVLSPFYIFQLFSMTLWCFENYYYYSLCIFIISATSIAYSLYSIRRNEQALRDMISNSLPVRVYRDREVVEVNSEHLVPGDLIEIEQGSQVTLFITYLYISVKIKSFKKKKL